MPLAVAQLRGAAPAPRPGRSRRARWSARRRAAPRRAAPARSRSRPAAAGRRTAARGTCRAGRATAAPGASPARPPRLASLLVMPCSRSARCTTLPTRNTGLNAGRRALEDRRDPAPAHLAQLALGQPGQLGAVQRDAAAARWRRRCGRGRAPPAWSWTCPTRSRRPARRSRPRRRPARPRSTTRRVAEAAPARPVIASLIAGTIRFGSSRSRSPSPSRLKANAVNRIASPGKVTTHQAVVK